MTGPTSNPTPEKTLLAFADHGRVTATLPSDGGDVDVVLAARLQREGAASFDTSWKELLGRLAAKRAALMP